MRIILLALLALPAWADLYSLTTSETASAHCTEYPSGTLIEQSESSIVSFPVYAEVDCGHGQTSASASLLGSDYGWLNAKVYLFTDDLSYEGGGSGQASA